MPMLNARSARGLRKRPISREPEPAQSVMQGNPTTISTKAITGTSNAMCPRSCKARDGSQGQRPGFRIDPLKGAASRRVNGRLGARASCGFEEVAMRQASHRR